MSHLSRVVESWLAILFVVFPVTMIKLVLNLHVCKGCKSVWTFRYTHLEKKKKTRIVQCAYKLGLCCNE